VRLAAPEAETLRAIGESHTKSNPQTQFETN
jgi:hypothetical protein